VPPAGSLWDVAAAGHAAADDRLPAPGPAAPPAPGPGTGDVWEVSKPGAADPQPASDSMYVWNPAETTETFPAVAKDDEA
jgi:hypothetical protein